MNSPNQKAPCFVAVIDLSLAEKLKNDLLAQGFEITVPQYTLFSAQKKGISCTLYASGKLTVQGKDKDQFITFYLEPEILQAFNYSYPEIKVDFTPRIGIDEAGKGDFFGPLCIAGVYANEQLIKKLLEFGVRDSKRMSDQTVLKLATKIKQTCPHSIVRIPPKRYNELYDNFRNLNYLLGWGHATAIAELNEKTSCTKATIDQFANEHVVIEALERKKISIELTQRHRGEEDPVVAAASILARAAFLEGLKKLSDEYGIELPKGASDAVVKAGKQLVEKYGDGILPNVAKSHFKTFSSVVESI
jgi:ribonuclease HIII